MKQYTFYTYDFRGTDVTVKVWADTQSEAWEQFRASFPDTPVDFVDVD